MAVIHYDGTGQATEAEMDDVETKAKTWRNGTTKVLLNVDKRFDVNAVQVALEWTVSDDQVEETISQLDTAVGNMDAALPLASDGAATVTYDD